MQAFGVQGSGFRVDKRPGTLSSVMENHTEKDMGNDMQRQRSAYEGAHNG